jgi:hypothetical protein
MTEATLNANNRWITWPDSTKVYLTTAADTANIKRSKTWCVTTNSKSYININNIAFTGGTGAKPVSGYSCYLINIPGGRQVNVSRCSFTLVPGMGIGASGVYTQISYSLFVNSPIRAIIALADSLCLYNNTIYGGYTGIGDYILAPKTYFFKNNIIYNPSTYFIALSPLAVLNLSNNLYYHATNYTNRWVRGSTSFSTLPSWADSTGQESGSLTGDPLFRIGEYRPYPNGPGVNKGVAVGLTFDYLGRSIIGTPDIGAYENHPSLYYPRQMILNKRGF